MPIVLMTSNPRKIAEYRRFFARHGQGLLVEQASESPAILATWLETARAVVTDESNIFTPEGDLVAADHVGPARNICRLHAWMREGDSLVRRTYLREVAGTFDARRLRPDDPTVFDWDAAFTNAAGATLERMAESGLKISAREQCLSAFAKAHLHHETRKTLRWTHAETADWESDARLLLDHRLYQGLSPSLASALSCVMDGGIFFRAARSRRDGNYWFPGLNGGVPYVPKSDAVHEATYMFHDVMHHLMPDLLFDGIDSPDHRRVYIAYRMMSEAVSLVLADMMFVDGLARDPVQAGYDFDKRKIFPLYRALVDADQGLQEPLPLLRAMVQFVVRGESAVLERGGDAWRAFSAKYTRFFVGDFQWTRMNWHNLVARSTMVRAWIELVHPEAFRAQGLWFLSDTVERVGRELPTEVLCARLFDLVWRERLLPALTYAGSTPDVDHARSSGFRRWLTGQLALFACYAPIVGVPPLAQQLAARVRDPAPFGRAELEDVRARLGGHVRSLAATAVISDDDAEIYPDLFPLFDPFFLRDYDLAQQEFETVAAASALALGSE
jgi:hypothetical protein